MNNIKSKILTYKYLKIAFSSILIIGVICFLLFTSTVNTNGVRNGLISIVLMLFGIVSNKYCDFQIYLLKKEIKTLQTPNRCKTKNKIINFDKIA